MKKPIHKVTSMLLTCTLLGSPMLWLNTPSAQAEATASVNAAVTKEQAVQMARTTVNLPESNWTLNNSEYRTGAKDKWGNTLSPRWQLEFSTSEGTVYAGASVTIDATTGKLLTLNRYSKDQMKDLHWTQEQAQAAAVDFIKKNAPEQFKETVLTNSHTDGIGTPFKYFNFTYERKTADGVIVLDDQITVTVQGDGLVSSYNSNWSNVTLPKAEATVTLASATQAYRDALDLQLSYQYTYGSVPRVNLLYSTSVAQNFMFPASAATLLFDAKTGQALDRFGKPTTPEKLHITPLDSKGPTEPTPRTTSLTQEEAEALLRSSGLLKSNTELGEASYNESNTKMWSFNLYNKTSNATTGRVSLDAMTGELVNFNTYNDPDTPSSGSVISNESLKTKAIELVKKLFPGRTGAVAFLTVSPLGDNAKESGSDQKGVSFTFLKNGIPTQNGLQITFDAQGNVNNFYGTTYYGSDVENKIEYPDPSKAVTLNQAKDTYLKNRPVRLSYFFPQAANGIRSTTPVLVYAPSVGPNDLWNNAIDGLTGEWISQDPSGQKPPTLPSDIKGHWAENALTQFANLGLLELKDGKAIPDGEISRGEFIHLLVNIRGGLMTSAKPTFQDVPTDSKYYDDIETAVQRGWIAKDNTFRPAEQISRQEVATILTRALGYETLAKHSELFVLPYVDGNVVSTWAKGSVAILNGLGVMQGANQYFTPNGNVTLAETCTALLNVQAINSPMNYIK